MNVNKIQKICRVTCKTIWCMIATSIIISIVAFVIGYSGIYTFVMICLIVLMLGLPEIIEGIGGAINKKKNKQLN